MNVDELVRVVQSSSGSSYAVLGGDDLPEVRIGPEPNPAISRETAEQLKMFLRALLAKNVKSPLIPSNRQE